MAFSGLHLANVLFSMMIGGMFVALFSVFCWPSIESTQRFLVLLNFSDIFLMPRLFISWSSYFSFFHAMLIGFWLQCFDAFYHQDFEMVYFLLNPRTPSTFRCISDIFFHMLLHIFLSPATLRTFLHFQSSWSFRPPPFLFPYISSFFQILFLIIFRSILWMYPIHLNCLCWILVVADTISNCFLKTSS